MGKLVGLQRRGNIWRYRRWMPLSLRDRIGKSELIKSLETSDYQTAVRRYRTVSRDIEQIITNARGDASTDDFNGSRLIQGSDTVKLQIKAPPSSDHDGLRTLIKTVVEEVLEVHAPRKTPITLDDLYHRYMDDPARSRSKKTVMTYQSVYNVLMELFGRERLITDISRDDCRQFMDVVRASTRECQETVSTEIVGRDFFVGEKTWHEGDGTTHYQQICEQTVGNAELGCRRGITGS